MMKNFLPLLVLLGLLTGCSRTAMLEKFGDEGKKAAARAYIQRLVDGDPTLVKELDPSVKVTDPKAIFAQMRAMVPKGPPDVTELVGYYVSKFTSGESTYNVSYQYRYGSQWLVINVVWREEGAERTITGLHVQPLRASLQEINAFSFQNAGMWHYLFVAALILNFNFILFTLITCIRTKPLRRKWLWIVFVLVGAIQFSFNWSTGEISFKPLAVLLFGGSIMTLGFGPWIISVALPLGAAVFWFKKRELDMAAARSAAQTPPAETAN